MKKCNKCLKTKTFDNFYKNSSKKDGYRTQCKECQSKKDKKYYLRDRSKILEFAAEYRDTHRKEIAANNKIWRERNKKEILEKKKVYNRNRYATDIVYRMQCRYRALLGHAFAGYSRNTKTEDILGIGWETYVEHLKKTFEDNYSIPFKDEFISKVDVDHVMPISIADDVETVKKLNHYKNLQLLWKEDNKNKSNKLDWTLNSIM